MTRRRRSMLRWTALACVLAGAQSAHAATKLEGYFQTQLDIRKEDRQYPWSFHSTSGDGSDWNYLELRLLAAPQPNVEAFIKTYAQWNPFLSSDRRPSFLLQEAHLKYRLEKGPRAYEAVAFTREQRFWVDNHLIGVVSGNASNDGNASGLRLETWGPKGFNAVYVASDFSGQSTPATGAAPNAPVDTDDAHILRVRRNFFAGDRVRLGLTEARSVRSPQIFQIPSGGGVVQRDTASWVNVLAVDTRVTIATTDIAIEYAHASKRDFQYVTLVDGVPCSDSPSGLDLSRLGDGLWRALPSNGVLRAEVRSLRVGTPRIGYLSIAPSYRVLGRHWDNPLGDGTRDEVGWFLNSWYLLPQRAITVTANYGDYRKRFDQDAHWKDYYVEMYTEYLGGFTSKFAYRERDGLTRPGRGSECAAPPASMLSFRQNTQEAFAEVTAQSTLAWARLQFKARRVEEGVRLTHQQLYALESSVNLSNTVKLYSRLSFGNDATRTRTGTFTELQFRPYGNMELFASYGPWWIGDSPNPVDDADLAGSAENRDIIKLTLRGWF